MNLAVFEGFLDAESGKRVFIFVDKVFDSLLVCFGIFSEGPTNGFTDKELRFVASLQTEAKQECTVCLFFPI